MGQLVIHFLAAGPQTSQKIVTNMLIAKSIPLQIVAKTCWDTATGFRSPKQLLMELDFVRRLAAADRQVEVERKWKAEYKS